METKTKNIVAILMATIIAMALITPMAMAQVEEDTAATVGNLPPYVCCQWEDPAVADPIVKTTVTIHACVCDPNGPNDISWVKACTPKGTIVLTPIGGAGTHTLCSDTTCICDVRPDLIDCYEYIGTITMAPDDQSGYDEDDRAYKVVITAKDMAGEESNRLVSYFEYESVIIPELNFPVTISYGVAPMGEKKYVGDASIHNAGNDPFQITVHATAMGKQADPDIGTEVDMGLDLKIGDGEKYEEKLLPACIPVDFDWIFKYCKTWPVSFSIEVPYETLPGAYAGTMTFEAFPTQECTQRFELGPVGDLDTYPNEGWSAKVAVQDTKGWYGGIEEDGARMVCGAGNPDLKAWVEFDNCEDMRLQKIRIKHLDGQAAAPASTDSFDVYIHEGGSSYKLGRYAAQAGTEDWVITMFHVEDAIDEIPEDICCPVKVEIVFTETPWSGYDTWGQLAIDWIEMTCCGTCNNG